MFELKRSVGGQLGFAGAPTVILIHGWCGDRTIWREQMRCAPLAAEIFAIDLPGHGCAATDETAELSIASFASAVVEFAEARTRGPIVLVGHSMGGPVALEAAIVLGDRCRLLVGVDTFTDSRFYARRPSEEVGQRLAAFAADFEGTLSAMVDRIVAPQVSHAVRAEIAASMARMPEARALAALRSLLAYDILERWPRLRAPAVTINASRLMDPDNELDLAGLVVHPMADVGHFPMLEAPEAFNALLTSIVETHRPQVSVIDGSPAMKSAMSSPSRLT